MKMYKYISVLLFGALTSCGQTNTATTGADTLTTDTVVKADTVLALDTPGADHVPLAQLIVPGSSLGQNTLNESAENINKRMGKADAGDAAMGKSLSTWYANHDTAGYQTQIFFTRQMGVDETSRAKQIRVTSPLFKTAQAIHVGTPLKTLISGFKLKKVATYRENDINYNVYDDEQAGIAFETDDKDTCSGLIIHEPGTKVMSNYQPFHSTVQVLK